METNSDILDAFNTILSDANLGYPIGWPGVNFTPPATGAWLEVAFFPNTGRQNGLANSAQLTPEGMYQVSCYMRKGKVGVYLLQQLADAVRATFPKGRIITGSVRVTRTPYDMQFEQGSDRIAIAVTIPYLG